MKSLEIKDLHVEVDGIEILKGVTLTFSPEKVHVLMGPNGSGKSSLAHAIMGHPKYKVTKGQIILDGKDITYMKPHLRAKEGVFLSFQYPAEISGVSISNFLRTAWNNLHEEKLSIIDFHKLLKEKMAELKMDPSFGKRSINEGFSGGEKKKAEILQMLLLNPRYAILDETDSGTDVDALKTVAESVNGMRKKSEIGIIIITHYNRFLEYMTPDEVSVMSKGKIIAQGSYDLAKEIEEKGFEGVIHAYERTAH